MLWFSLYFSMLYGCWLHEFRRNHPEINPDKIVFDNQKSVFTYEQRLPGIDEYVSVNSRLVFYFIIFLYIGC